MDNLQLAVVDGIAKVITVNGDGDVDVDSSGGVLLEVWTCQWFALCQNDATMIIEHPTLGGVPTCDRCAKIARP